MPRADLAQQRKPARDDLPGDRFLDQLRAGPLVLDAAMGTRLCRAGLDLGCDDPALWNLTNPELVADMHRRDAAAGADVLLTNTFGANRFWLARFGRRDAVESINRRAAQLARSAAGPRRFLLGALGPTTAQEAGAAAEQAAILVDAGVDALLFETFRAETIDSVLLEVASLYARGVPLIVSLWDWPDPPGETARRLLQAGACVLGMNCQPGTTAALAFAEKVGPDVGCPLLVKPSASQNGASEMSPAELAAAVPGLLERNVRLIGGCCGTTEEHVAAVADACTRFHRQSSREPIGARS
jgi:5-methyltetrahydrofolate--homocysteine methyltransferase